jgi:hypothetical protein
MRGVGYRNVQECWQYISGTRHKPGGNADEPRRRARYTSALEQAEQLFRLSDRAGYETKPVLIYNGLNQAGRALVAAAAELGENL